MTSSGHAYVRSLRDAESPAAAFAIAQAALADPIVFFYGSILHSDGFKAALRNLQGAEETAKAKSLTALLHLMSYGTIGDVTGGGAPSGNVHSQALALAQPQLNDALRHKLQLLSVLTFSSRHGNGRSNVPYEELRAFLGAADTEEMEAVVVSAVASHLLKARLNPQAQCVRIVELSQGRDVSAGELGALQAKLNTWGSACDRQLKQLDRTMEACDVSDTRLSALTRGKPC